MLAAPRKKKENHFNKIRYSCFVMNYLNTKNTPDKEQYNLFYLLMNC